MDVSRRRKVLCKYARLLQVHYKDYERAERMFDQSLKYGVMDLEGVKSFAVLLDTVRYSPRPPRHAARVEDSHVSDGDVFSLCHPSAHPSAEGFAVHARCQLTRLHALALSPTAIHWPMLSLRQRPGIGCSYWREN